MRIGWDGYISLKGTSDSLFHRCQSARKVHLANILLLTLRIPSDVLLPAVFLSVPRYDLRVSAFQAKAGIKVNLADCLCYRDNAVGLCAVDFARVVSVDSELGGMGRCIDVQRRRSVRLIEAGSRSVYLTVTQHHALKGRRHCCQLFERRNAFHNDGVRCFGAE